MNAMGKNNDLIFSFDVGHSSIGWNVLRETQDLPEQVALGTVLFENDGCLASQRRTYRRMRRTIRSRRQRIEALEKLFIHQKLLSEADIEATHKQGGGHPAPWLLAATVLAAKDFLLSTRELFDVLRWYAHNRGYDGNRRWATNADESKEDSKREEAARSMMKQFGTATMAETVCAQLGVEPGGQKRASSAAYKVAGAAFPRSIVAAEVGRILKAHIGKLQGCTESFIATLCGDEEDAWKTLPVEGIKKPKTFHGGLLFGQKVPRFDNRILPFCPISDTPTPLKTAREFLEFRCAMFLSNIRVQASDLSAVRPLSRGEFSEIWARIQEQGYMTKGDLQKAIRLLDGVFQHNLDALMTIEDADTNLIVNPPLKLFRSNAILKEIHPAIPSAVAEEMLAALWKKKTLTLTGILDSAPQAGGLASAVEIAYSKDKKGQKKYGSKERWLEDRSFSAEFDRGRAPYSRAVMRQAVEQVLSGVDPRAAGGCLYMTEEMQSRLEKRAIDDLTNNHLVRHRLLILQRLLKDMLAEFAEGDKKRIKTIVVEMNREVAEMSGMKVKQIAQEEGLKRTDHKHARKALEDAIKEDGENIRVTAGLIRKARVARDLGATCPYTGKSYDLLDLIHGQVDLDHIIPRSERLSDSMAGMVITFSEVNRWKGARTAFQFVSEEQGKPVPGMPQLQICPLSKFKEFVDELKISGGHKTDENRRKARKAALLLPTYEDKEFTPRDLTISSHVSKLAMQQLRKEFGGLSRPPKIVALPGRLTGEARKGWKLMGLLHAVNEAINPETLKDEVRDLTHLHHALDAAVMGLMAHCAGNLSDGTTWQLLLKRNLQPREKSLLLENMRNIGFSEGRAHLLDVPDEIKAQLRKRLLERRVVQHVPASMDGLRVEDNTRGVVAFDREKGKVQLSQGGKPSEESPSKLLGFNVENSKLRNQKGVRVIDSNFGVALTEPEPEVIVWHKVWPRLKQIEKRTGKRPVVLRNGMVLQVPDGTYRGIWRVMSVKNSATGLALDMCKPDETKSTRRNALLKSIIKDRAVIIRTRLTGDGICRITSSMSGAPLPG